MKMSKRITIFITVFSLLCLGLFAQEEEKEIIKKTYDFKPDPTRYLPLVIAPTDLLCSYFITKKIDERTHIIGGQEMDMDRVSYSDYDVMFINVGANDGVKEGDMFSIIGKGKKISNPFTHKRLGRYYLRKSLARVTCVYKDTSLVTLTRGCSPVEVADIVLPYKEGNIVKKKKIEYNRCRLPDSPIEGTVVYTNLFMDVNKDNAGPESYVTIDIGQVFVSRGDYVIFYKNFKKKGLPPLIFGSGIVIDTHNTNSTVRIIESTSPIEVGTKLVLMPDIGEETGQPKFDDEEIPFMDEFDKLEKDQQKEMSLEIEIFFDLDDTTLPAKYSSELDKIKEYIKDKKKYAIILRGYTCSIGSVEYNLKVSQHRVENIKSILINDLGIDKDKIESYYYGEKDAPYDNSTEEERRKNRLVKIQVIGK